MTPEGSGAGVTVREVRLFSCGGWVWVLSVGFWVGDGRRTWSGDPVGRRWPGRTGSASPVPPHRGRRDCGRQKPLSLVSAWRRPRAGDGAPPLPRSGCVVGHTGPSSVTGSNKRVSCAASYVQEGECPESCPLAGVRGFQFAACIQEPGVAVCPVLFDEAYGEPSGPRLRATPFRSLGRVAPGRLSIAWGTGEGHGSGLGWRRWRPRPPTSRGQAFRLCRNLLSSQGGDRPIAPTGERGGIGMGQDVESSGRRGEEMALFACAAGLAPGDDAPTFGMGQGVESPDCSGACLSGAGLVPLGFRFLLRLREFMFGRRV